MPKTAHYESDSIIASQGSDSGKIYYLNDGLIHLISQTLAKEEKALYVRDVKPREFFGIEYAIANSPQDETVQAKEKSIVTSYTLTEFKSVMLKQQDSMVSALRSLSGKLRDLNAMARKMVADGSELNPPQGILVIGEDLYRNSEYKQAQYIFETYLNQYPNGKNKDRVKSMLKRIRNTEPYSEEAFPLLKPENLPKTRHQSQDANRQLKKSSATSLQPRLVMGIQSFKKGQYLQAIMNLQKVIDALEARSSAAAPSSAASAASAAPVAAAASVVKNSQSQPHKKQQAAAPDYIQDAQQAFLYKGIAEWQLQKFDAAIITLSRYLMLYPKGLYWRASVFQLGLLMEKKNNIERARYFYSRLLLKKTEQRKKQKDRFALAAKKALAKIDALASYADARYGRHEDSPE